MSELAVVCFGIELGLEQAVRRAIDAGGCVGACVVGGAATTVNSDTYAVADICCYPLDDFEDEIDEKDLANAGFDVAVGQMFGC